MSLLHKELALGVPHVPPTWLPPLPAFCFAALFLSAWWMACPSGLPEALLNEAVFPPLLLSYLLALITLHCSYLGLMPPLDSKPLQGWHMIGFLGQEMN